MHSVGLQMTRPANIVLKHCFASNAMMAEMVDDCGRHRFKTLFCYGCDGRDGAELRQIEITRCANIVLKHCFASARIGEIVQTYSI